MVWVFEWGPECEEIMSKSFLWQNNTTFDVLNLIIGKNCEEILVPHVCLVSWAILKILFYSL